MDDLLLIKDNAYIKDVSYIKNIFTSDIGKGFGKITSAYRPLQNFTYLIDYHLWKLNPAGFHLTNILLHILTAIALFHFVNILYGDKLLSLLTGILFVVAPIHTEAVAYISGRADSLYALFILLGFIFYIKYLRAKDFIAYLLLLASYILALLSKEISLIFPVLLLLYHYSFRKKLKIQEYAPIVCVAFIYILLRIGVLRHSIVPISNETTFIQRVPGFFAAITDYVKLLIIPQNLHMEYGKGLFSFTHPKVIAGIVILLLLSGYALKKRNSNRIISFSIAWFFVTLAPVSNLYPINAYMAEHWLYLASMGFFLILAKFLSCLYDKKRLKIFTLLTMLVLVSSYSLLTVKQNSYWIDPLYFYNRTLQYAPQSERAYFNLGRLYSESNNFEEAIKSYMKVIEINPHYKEAYLNLGVIYHKIGESLKAIAFTKKAIELNPNYAEAYYNLCCFYHNEKKYEQAIRYCDRAAGLGFTNPALLEALKPYR